MRFSFKIFLLTVFFLSAANQVWSQLILSGTVYDSSKINLVEGVRVVSTGGLFDMTDSLGRYNIMVNEKDSVSFIYNNKPTQKFPVKTINDPNHFDIFLHLHVKGKYTTLKEVIVYGKSYRRDSLENRQLYAGIYDYRKPTLSSSISPDGVAGADINEIINMFRFRRNKRLRAFQLRLEGQEQEKYVSYRFNKNFVRRITQLQGTELDSFMVRYIPSYEFASTADEVTFNKYILNSSYAFKIVLLQQEAAKAKKEN